MASMSPALRIATIAATIFLLIVFAVVQILNVFSNQPDKGVFVKTMREASDTFRTDITPAGWAFSIWSIIYIMQAAIIVYCIVNLFRKTQYITGNDESRGSVTRHFENPGLFPLSCLISYGSSYLLTICWLFFFDRATIHRALLALAMSSLWLVVGVLAICLFFSYRKFAKEEPWLHSLKGGIVDIWFTRIVTHNGLSIYATWCSVAAPLNTAMVMSYMGSLSIETAGTVSLAIVAVEMVVYAAVDALFLDKWTRYTVTPHCVLVWAFSASLAKNYRSGSRNTIFTIVLLSIAGVALVGKVLLMVIRHIKRSSTRAAGISGKMRLDDASMTSDSTIDIRKTVA